MQRMWLTVVIVLIVRSARDVKPVRNVSRQLASLFPVRPVRLIVCIVREIAEETVPSAVNVLIMPKIAIAIVEMIVSKAVIR